MLPTCIENIIYTMAGQMESTEKFAKTLDVISRFTIEYDCAEGVRIDYFCDDGWRCFYLSEYNEAWNRYKLGYGWKDWYKYLGAQESWQCYECQLPAKECCCADGREPQAPTRSSYDWPPVSEWRYYPPHIPRNPLYP